MALIRPRLTDFYGIAAAQADLNFAIPLLDADIPLYVDPFLLWKSPSQQDQALHTSLVNSFNRQNWLLKKGRDDEAERNLIGASECDEVGLGTSANRRGKRIGTQTAKQILNLFQAIPMYEQSGFTHFEEIQLYVDGISKDRISDIACNFLKSFLIDYTIDECKQLTIPLSKVTLPTVFNYQKQSFEENVTTELPVGPDGRPILLVPKRWLRYTPWINYDDYFAAHCPKDEIINQQGSDERVNVLRYNRDHYGVIEEYVRAKERVADDCRNDPLFTQIPVISARRTLAKIQKLPTGNQDAVDKKYEDAAAQLLASLLYPQLDFADTQSRTDSGSSIRDLIFYNTRSNEFLSDIAKDYDCRQLVIEMKNVRQVEREHIAQLNRYLANEFGRFRVLLTRNPLPKAMRQSTIDLWSGQRRCIITLTDADLELMVEVYESKQRLPIEVLKRSYVDFRRSCPV